MPTSRYVPMLLLVSVKTTAGVDIPSLGFMWNAKQENFLKDIDWLTNAQVALSTGTSGSEIPE